jgi:L-amino acid N-acyltransferase YncA
MPEGRELPPVEPALWDELLAMPELTLLVAEEDGELRGYAGCGSSRDPDTAPEVGEVRSMFVASGSWRTGVGRGLMEAALDELRERGYSDAIVWSFADNERANAFYESFGFERDGGERSEERWGHISEVRYRRRL